MKESFFGSTRAALAGSAVIGCLVIGPARAANVTFVGQQGSGDVSVADNWNPKSLPTTSDTAIFNQKGTLTAASPLSPKATWFRGTGNAWSLRTGENLTLSDLFVGRNNDNRLRLVVEEGTVLDTGSGKQLHLGYQSYSNVLEVAEGGFVDGEGTFLRIGDGDGSQRALGGNVFRAGKNTSVTFADVQVGGDSGPGNRLEVLGATNFTSSGGLLIARTASCSNSVALFRNAKNVLLKNSVNVGQYAVGCELSVSNVTDFLVVPGDVNVYTESRAEFNEVRRFASQGALSVAEGSSFGLYDAQDVSVTGAVRVSGSFVSRRVKDLYFGNEFVIAGTDGPVAFSACTNVTVVGQLSNAGNLLLDGVSAFHVGGKLDLGEGSDVRIVNSDDVTFGANSGSGGSLLVSNVTAVTIPGFAVRDGGKMVLKDSKATFSGGVVVNNGSFQLENLSAGSVYPTSVQLNGNGTGDVHAELAVPADYNPRNVTIGSTASAYLRSLIYDAGGGSFASSSLTGFVSDGPKPNNQDNGLANVSVELRNGTFTLGLSDVASENAAQRYRPANTNRTYIIGPGATLTARESKYGPVFWQEGGTAAYGEPVLGIAIIADGGTIDFRDPNTGGYNLGSGGWGYGSVFEVKNGGQVKLALNFNVGAESGIADACRVLVGTNGSVVAGGNLGLLTSNNRIVIDNGSIAVKDCWWPTQNSIWPANAAGAWAQFAGQPRAATNNVIRFTGETARLTASGGIYSKRSAAQDVDLALEFVIPADGYAEPPMTAGDSMTFEGTVRLHVDASAYKGRRQWLTLMKAMTGAISIADPDAFVSELPDGCKVRFKDASHKEVVVRVGPPEGLIVIVR